MPDNSVYMMRLPSSGNRGGIAADFQRGFIPGPPENNSCKLIPQESANKTNIGIPKIVFNVIFHNPRHSQMLD